jgi:hypothetical protein
VVSGIQALYACLGGLGLASFAAGVYALARSDRRHGEAGGKPVSIIVPPATPADQEKPTTAGDKDVVHGYSHQEPPKARSAGSTEA